MSDLLHTISRLRESPFEINKELSNLASEIRTLGEEITYYLQAEPKAKDISEELELKLQDSLEEIAVIKARVRGAANKIADSIPISTTTVSQIIMAATKKCNIPSKTKLVTKTSNDKCQLRGCFILIDVISMLLKYALSSGASKIKILAARNEESSTIEIIISDNGKGIPLNLQNEIFESFYSKQPTSEYSGSLHRVQDQVRSIKGDLILVTSELGKGSTFKINIPTAIRLSKDH